jgi:hypothetical protein
MTFGPLAGTLLRVTSPGLVRARRLAAIPLAGAVIGVLVGGVLGRLVMFLLFRLSPEAEGLTSDDGFTMGQFTVSGSAQLLLAGAQLGFVGGIVYLGVRWLLFGPPWFRVLSVTLAAGVGVGALLVHTDGVDFVVLQPAWVSILAFVALPASYGALLTVVAEQRVLGGWGEALTHPLAWALRALALVAGVLLSVQLLQKVVELV